MGFDMASSRIIRRFVLAVLGALVIGAAQPASAQKQYQTVSIFDKFDYQIGNYPVAMASNGTILADNRLITSDSVQTLPDVPGSAFT